MASAGFLAYVAFFVLGIGFDDRGKLMLVLGEMNAIGALSGRVLGYEVVSI